MTRNTNKTTNAGAKVFPKHISHTVFVDLDDGTGQSYVVMSFSMRSCNFVKSLVRNTVHANYRYLVVYPLLLQVPSSHASRVSSLVLYKISNERFPRDTGIAL
jgi:hypothetical protein